MKSPCWFRLSPTKILDVDAVYRPDAADCRCRSIRSALAGDAGDRLLVPVQQPDQGHPSGMASFDLHLPYLHSHCISA